MNPLFGSGLKVIDIPAAAGNVAWHYQNLADDSAGFAGLAAFSGRAAAESTLSDAKSNYDYMVDAANLSRGNVADAQRSAKIVNTMADQAAASAGGMTQDINAVRKSAANVESTASQISPIAAILGGYGDDIWNQANGQVNTGNQILGVGSSMLSLDPSVGGIAGEYAKLYNALAGDKAASRAAADVQSSYSNAYGQLVRDLSRRGVSSSSGNALALRQQFDQALATALAGAKTLARNGAIKDQASMLGSITNAANALIGSGNQTISVGQAGQANAITAKNSAVNAIQQQGALQAQAGNLHASAGNLGAAQASAYTNAGKLYEESANIVNSALNAFNSANANINSAMSAVNSATGNVVSAAGNEANVNLNAANYYADVAAGFAQIAGSQGLFNTSKFALQSISQRMR